MHSSSEISFNLPRKLSVNQVSWWAYQAWKSLLVLLAMSEREASTMVTQWCAFRPMGEYSLWKYTPCLTTCLTTSLGLLRHILINLIQWQASSTFSCGNPHRDVTNLECVAAGRSQTRRRPLRQATHTSSMAEWDMSVGEKSGFWEF